MTKEELQDLRVGQTILVRLPAHEKLFVTVVTDIVQSPNFAPIRGQDAGWLFLDEVTPIPNGATKSQIQALKDLLESASQ